MILIIGSEDELHSKHVYNAIKSKRLDAEYFDSRKYPNSISLSYDEETNGYIKTDNKKIYLKDIQGIYWRWFYGIKREYIENDYVSNMIFRERTSALNSLFCSLKCNRVNSYEAIELHKTKAYQLNILKENGIRIPKTIITNDKESLIAFYENNNRNVIYKPVLGGAMTTRLTDNDLTVERLNELQMSPVQLQEFIAGVDIRVFAMGDEVFAAEIQADTIDFREDKQAKIIPVELPENIKQDCLKVLKLLKLSYSGIDIRKTKDNDYVFIEANPAPMFIHFENITHYPITDKIIELLTQKI